MAIYVTSPLPKVKRDRKFVKASGWLQDSVYETHITAWHIKPQQLAKHIQELHMIKPDQVPAMRGKVVMQSHP